MIFKELRKLFNINKNSKSKTSNTNYKGIQYRKNHKKPYISRLWIKGINDINIGSYYTLQEAIEARENYIKNLF